MKEVLDTKVSYETTDKEGNVVVRITSEDAFNKIVQRASENGAPQPKLLKKQTFYIRQADTVDEALSLSGGDEQIMLSHFNYGARLAQHNAANDLLLDDDFTPTDSAYDLSEAVSTQTGGRARLSAEEKAVRALKKLGIDVSPDRLRAVLAQISQ